MDNQKTMSLVEKNNILSEQLKVFGTTDKYNETVRSRNINIGSDKTTVDNMSDNGTGEEVMEHMSKLPASQISTNDTGSIGIDNSIYSDIYDKVYGKTTSLDQIVRKSVNIETSSGLNVNTSDSFVYEYFDRFYSVQPDYELASLCHYVFMTKPDLNILDKNGTSLTPVCANVPQFQMMLQQSPHVLKSLCQDVKGIKSGTTFIPMLVSRTHALQIPDLTINSNNLSQPYTGYLLPYASHAIASTTGGEFDITFREFGDLTIHKLFNTWITYIDGVTRNLWTPNLKYIDNDYGIVCDYMVSVYDIICAPDASTILFMVKYTGCVPLSAPNSNLSFNLGDGGQDHDLSIPFRYFYCEVLNPEIFADFNVNAGVYKDVDPVKLPTAIHNIQPGVYGYCTSSSFVKRPFIVYNSSTNLYMLKWEAI